MGFFNNLITKEGINLLTQSSMEEPLEFTHGVGYSEYYTDPFLVPAPDATRGDRKSKVISFSSTDGVNRVVFRFQNQETTGSTLRTFMVYAKPKGAPDKDEVPFWFGSDEMVSLYVPSISEPAKDVDGSFSFAFDVGDTVAATESSAVARGELNRFLPLHDLSSQTSGPDQSVYGVKSFENGISTTSLILNGKTINTTDVISETEALPTASAVKQYVDSGAVTPTNVVTIDTDQTVTGVKTFTGASTTVSTLKANNIKQSDGTVLVLGNSAAGSSIKVLAEDNADATESFLSITSDKKIIPNTFNVWELGDGVNNTFRAVYTNLLQSSNRSWLNLKSDGIVFNENIIFCGNNFYPNTSKTINLGKLEISEESGKTYSRFENGYFNNLDTGTLVTSGATTIGGNLEVKGNASLTSLALGTEQRSVSIISDMASGTTELPDCTAVKNYVTSSIPTNTVTIDTAQTISGNKTFTGTTSLKELNTGLVKQSDGTVLTLGNGALGSSIKLLSYHNDDSGFDNFLTITDYNQIIPNSSTWSLGSITENQFQSIFAESLTSTSTVLYLRGESIIVNDKIAIDANTFYPYGQSIIDIGKIEPTGRFNSGYFNRIDTGSFVASGQSSVGGNLDVKGIVYAGFLTLGQRSIEIEDAITDSSSNQIPTSAAVKAYVANSTSVPTNMVTTDTAQTITGVKTFTGATTSVTKLITDSVSAEGRYTEISSRNNNSRVTVGDEFVEIGISDSTYGGAFISLTVDTTTETKFVSLSGNSEEIQIKLGSSSSRWVESYFENIDSTNATINTINSNVIVPIGTTRSASYVGSGSNRWENIYGGYLNSIRGTISNLTSNKINRGSADATIGAKAEPFGSIYCKDFVATGTANLSNSLTGIARNDSIGCIRIVAVVASKVLVLLSGGTIPGSDLRALSMIIKSDDMIVTSIDQKGLEGTWSNIGILFTDPSVGAYAVCLVVRTA